MRIPKPTSNFQEPPMTISSGSVFLQALFKQVGANDYSGPIFKPNFLYDKDFTGGVGNLQFDEAFIDERTVASATNDDLDLSGSALQNAFGVNIAFVEIVFFGLINAPKDPLAAPNTTNLTVGGAANPVAGFTFPALKPGGAIALCQTDTAGFPVVAGTGDILRIANSAGASAIYQICILGRLS